MQIFNNVLFENTILRNSNFQENKLKNIVFKNSDLTQAQFFKTSLNGIILTKLDSTAKGGVVFSIVSELNLPIKYIGVGEQIDDIEIFNPKEFVEAII